MITTERNVMIGAHVTPQIKDALREESRVREISMSRLVYQLLHESMLKLGYKVRDAHSRREDGR